MRANEALRALTGGLIVYVAMAACSSAEHTDSTGAAGGPTADAGGSGGADALGEDVGVGGTDGAGGAEGDASSDAVADAGDSSLLDALTDPVPDAKADTDTSGTRLKAKRQIGDDGSSHFLGWYDSQRQEDCWFRVAADGVSRCLPIAPDSAPLGRLTILVFGFLDSACTQRFASYDLPACVTPKYASELAEYDCAYPSGRTRIYSLGGQIAAPSYWYQLGGSGGTQCQMMGAPAGGAFVQVGAEIQPPAFVGSTVQVDP